MHTEVETMPKSPIKPRIILLGAAGRMGRAISARFLTDGRVDLVGACDPAGIGKSTGALANVDIDGPTISASVENLPGDLTADIALDFSTPDGTRKNLPLCIERGWDVLIGVTGYSEKDIEIFNELSLKHSRRIVLVPNFTPGVNLMLKFAKEAAKFFNHVEIIELHHDKKTDAPSGTALHTAQLIGSNRVPEPPPGPDDRSRGRIENEIPIHAVRLPGLLAHQEILFGSEGEVLTIRHDTTDRSAFLSGIYLAIDKLPNLPPGFIKGLDWAFEE